MLPSLGDRVRRRLWVYGGLIPIAFGMVAPASASQPFHLRHASVRPRSVIFGRQAVHIGYRFTSGANRVSIRIANNRTGRVVRRFVRTRASGVGHIQGWDGTKRSGRPVVDGRYGVTIGPPGGPFRGVGSFRLHGHEFPVRAPHGTRGAIGDFGAPRSGGRTHDGFDITASCGSELVAVRSGRVLRVGYDPVLYGNFILIHGRGEQRSYFYAHLIAPPPVPQGARVRTGQALGEVGQTGNAASTPCHLHFEIHYHGVPFDPEPSLERWDRYS